MYTHTFSSILSLSEQVEEGILSNGAESSVLYPALLSSIMRLRPNNCKWMIDKSHIPRIEQLENRYTLNIWRPAYIETYNWQSYIPKSKDQCIQITLSSTYLRIEGLGCIARNCAFFEISAFSSSSFSFSFVLSGKNEKRKV